MGEGDKKGLGKTVLGWFVEQDQGAASATAKPSTAGDADALIAKYAGAAAGSAPAPALTPAAPLAGPLPSVTDGKIDFVQVFEATGVSAEERGRVDKAKELLRSLPAETPATVKKQIVEAALKAFGVSTEKIIEAALAETQALEGFISAGQADTQKVLSEGTARIADLEKEIAQVKQVMQQAVADQEARTQGANGEKLAISQVLDFFGRDMVAKVVQDSPKLHQSQSPKG
jgi:hypothetical protein